MHVMVMIKATRNSEAGILPSRELLTRMSEYNEDLADAGILRSGEGLRPSSRGKRVSISPDERTVTDGPFDTTSELIAGFWIWSVRDMDEAVEWARRCPEPMPGEETQLEIRPLFEMEDFGEEMTPDLRAREEQLRADLQEQEG